MVQTEEITNALKSFDFPVGKIINDAEIDYFVDYFEPTEVYAFEVDEFFDLEELVEDRTPEAGILVAHVNEDDEVYACGVGQYREIQASAFQPIKQYF